jgi:hypothetical protein
MLFWSISNSFAIACVGKFAWLSVSEVTTVGHVTIYRHKKLSPQKAQKKVRQQVSSISKISKIDFVRFVPFCG